MTDPTERFSDRAQDYVLARPGYPKEVLEWLQAAGALPGGAMIADIGAGTGIASTLFLAAGYQVLAVEPNAAMRARAEQRLGPQYPGFSSVQGRAEATTLPSQSVDLVTVAQALHWFDIDACRREFMRILKPGGALVVLYNTRCNDASPFMRDYEALVQDYSIDYEQFRHENLGPDVFGRLYGSAGYRYHAIANLHPANHAQMVARASSSSYLPGHGQPRHEALLKALDAVFDRHQAQGQVTFVYKTEIYCGFPSAAASTGE